MKEGKAFVGVEQLIRGDIHLLLLCVKSSEVNKVHILYTTISTFRVIIISENVFQKLSYKTYPD